MTFVPAVRYRHRVAAGYDTRSGSTLLRKRFAEGTEGPATVRVSTAGSAGLSRRPSGAGGGRAASLPQDGTAPHRHLGEAA